jgi:predicted nucleic acid-binding protein
MMSPPTLVLDASVTLAWAFEDEEGAYTEAVLESLKEAAACVPAIWPLEVGNALLVAERRGRLTQAATAQFLALLGQLHIVVEPERPEQVLGGILSLAREQGLSAYDATYLHLAMRRGLPLATTDAKLRQAAVLAGAALFES